MSFCPRPCIAAWSALVASSVSPRSFVRSLTRSASSVTPSGNVNGSYAGGATGVSAGAGGSAVAGASAGFASVAGFASPSSEEGVSAAGFAAAGVAGVGGVTAGADSAGGVTAELEGALVGSAPGPGAGAADAVTGAGAAAGAAGAAVAGAGVAGATTVASSAIGTLPHHLDIGFRRDRRDLRNQPQTDVALAFAEGGDVRIGVERDSEYVCGLQPAPDPCPAVRRA